MLNNTAVIVLGMHRSGTSALAGMLSVLGIKFGKSLLPPHADNPRGYWEHEELVNLNDRLLAALGSSWDDMRLPQQSWWTDERISPFRAAIARILRRDFAKEALWGFKDPRLCRLVPLWCGILDELGCRTCFVLILRHPLEVAYSLRRRNEFDLRKSGLLWLEHNLLSERWSRDRPRIFASYDQILEQPDVVWFKISNMIGRSTGAITEHQIGAARAFVTPGLRHHRSIPDAWGSEFGEYRSLIEETYRRLSANCADGSEAGDEDLDRLLAGYQVITSNFDPLLRAHCDDLAIRLGELRDEISRMSSSPSWRMTRPLRGAIKLVRSVRRAPSPK